MGLQGGLAVTACVWNIKGVLIPAWVCQFITLYQQVSPEKSTFAKGWPKDPIPSAIPTSSCLLYVEVSASMDAHSSHSWLCRSLWAGLCVARVVDSCASKLQRFWFSRSVGAPRESPFYALPFLFPTFSSWRGRINIGCSLYILNIVVS